MPTNDTASDLAVLFIDDGADLSDAELRKLFNGKGISPQVLHPEEVTVEDLTRSKVVVVDYFLSYWDERDESATARAPKDGLAVCGILRSVLRPSRPEREQGMLPPPVAFVLSSADMPDATFRLPLAIQNKVFARDNDLEWALDRQEILHGNGSDAIAELARAVAALPDRWPKRGETDDGALKALTNLLGLNHETAPWAPTATEQLLDCRPPIAERSEQTHGLLVLRWLLQEIIPYPTFLLDERHVCALLRTDALSDDPAAAKALNAVRYSGVLSNFAGPRWWRAGVYSWLWQNPRDDVDTETLSATSTWNQPVVTINADYEFEPRLSEIADVVRVRPDDWPVFADNAYARVESVQAEASLQAILEPVDRYRVEAEATTD